MCASGSTRIPMPRRLHLSINLSARELQQPDVVAQVVEALDATGFDAAHLTLEITETALMHDTTTTSARLSELRALGARIALDDFGTGYSSLSHLRNFPIDVLKVDKSFIDDIASGSEKANLARGIIELGRTMNLDIVAEGIEHPQQVVELVRLHCVWGRGTTSPDLSLPMSWPLPARAARDAGREAIHRRGVTPPSIPTEVRDAGSRTRGRTITVSHSEEARMEATGRHSLRILVVAIAALTGLGAAGLSLAGLTPASLGDPHERACARGHRRRDHDQGRHMLRWWHRVLLQSGVGDHRGRSGYRLDQSDGCPAHDELVHLKRVSRSAGEHRKPDLSNAIGAAKGSTELVTFTSPGKYTYYCMIHGYVAMHGTIIVTGAVAPKISKFTPKTGPVGTKVTITGKNLAMASAVTFNGTAAVITADTATRIVVKVPAGATTGKIVVTDPDGTATSATSFKVT